jgi:hypothetical protein
MIALLDYCAVAPLHDCTFGLLRRSAVALLHFWIIALLRRYIVAILDYRAVAPLHDCTFGLLRRCAVALLRLLRRCSRDVPAKTFGSPYPTSASRHAAGGTSLNAIGYLRSRGWGRPGTVSRTARYPARHGIPHGSASRTARYPAWHGIPHGTVSRTARYPTQGMNSRTRQRRRWRRWRRRSGRARGRGLGTVVERPTCSGNTESPALPARGTR